MFNKLTFVAILGCAQALELLDVAIDVPILKNFTIDLDLPPEERFVEPTKVLKNDLMKVFEGYMSMIPKQVISLYESKITQLFWYLN